MKSPSPDTTNQNIIKDTKIPIDDIKRYLNTSRRTPSPRLPNASNIMEMGELKETNRRLEQTGRQLRAQNEEYLQALQEKATQRGRALSQGSEEGTHGELHERVVGLLQ
jgi:DNA-binding transcriptional MerR regulator